MERRSRYLCAERIRELQNIAVLLLLSLVSFLLGSIPCGVLISKVFFHKDVRDEGSGNIGFTNSMRSMGKVGGGAVFVGDFLKGMLAAAIGLYVAPIFLTGAQFPLCENPAELTAALATFFATMGHIFCPWLGWKGGKGISTAFGASFISMSVPVACMLFGAFLVVVLATKYVSAGSVTAAALYPLAAFVTHWNSPLPALILSVAGLVVIWAHRGNIVRIKNGTERKIGASKKSDN